MLHFKINFTNALIPAAGQEKQKLDIYFSEKNAKI